MSEEIGRRIERILIVGNAGAGRRTLLSLLCSHGGEKLTNSPNSVQISLDANKKIILDFLIDQESTTALENAINSANHFIVIYDKSNKDSRNSIKEWTSKITKAPVHKIANKCDLATSDSILNRRELVFSAIANDENNVTKFKNFVNNVLDYDYQEENSRYEVIERYELPSTHFKFTDNEFDGVTDILKSRSCCIII